ncbi:hypothetical protein [Vibrio profundum]
MLIPVTEKRSRATLIDSNLTAIIAGKLLEIASGREVLASADG